jgi:hypothetical protein
MTGGHFVYRVLWGLIRAVEHVVVQFQHPAARVKANAECASSCRVEVVRHV